MKLSIVIPVYKSRESINLLAEKIQSSLLNIDKSEFEVIFVNDGSPDDSWELIQNLSVKHESIKGLKFSRNFGQHNAITAGLQHAQGKYIVVMDCDLQDDPIYLQEMLKAVETNNIDIVFTIKKSRSHSVSKNISARLFFYFFNLLCGTQEANRDIGNFSLITQKVKDAFLKYIDVHRHYLMILRDLGFKSQMIEIDHLPRPFGRTSYSFSKLLKHAEDGVISQSNRLLYFSTFIGFGFVFVSVLVFLYLISRFFLYQTLPGYTSLMAILLLSTGVISISLGIHGMYLGKIFDQIKSRPLYIIEDRVNL